MTSRTITYVDYCCKDKYGSPYGVFRKMTQAGGNYVAGESKGSPHGYTATHTSHRVPLVTFRNKAIPSSTDTVSSLRYAPSFQTEDTNGAYIKALGKLYGDVKGADFNAALSSVEMHQNIRMIGDNARRIGKAYKAARSGNFGAAYKALAMRSKDPDKNVAKTWLEIQYGWLPLLKDVKGAVDFVQHRMQDPVIPKYRARAQVTHNGGSLFNTFNYSSISTVSRCQLIYYPSAPLSLSEALGLHDPYSILWEKLPYSFVIDWFLPIGPWLEAMTAARQLKGRVIRTTTTIKQANGLVDTNTLNIEGGGNVQFRTVAVARSVTGQPVPPSLPTFNPLEKALSVRHALNGIALLANLKR